MATTTEDLEHLEATAAERLAADDEPVDAGIDGGGPGESDADAEPPSLRIAIAVGFPVLSAAVMVGGIFLGVAPRIFAAVSGILGIALAYGASRVSRRPFVSNAIVFAGLFLIGIVMVIPSGVGNITSVTSLALDAARTGDVLRPPVPFTVGWQAVIGWLMGCVGFVAAWVALSLRRPSLSLLLPLPIAAIAAISVPKSDQVASGIAVLALFAIGLGLLSGAQAVGQHDERPPLAY
ncbi:MAG: hypothetical protein QOJ09_650, partial [Actinomycetota bacterium]|nr:hypothetical protein [Actinomycetota bacterium]